MIATFDKCRKFSSIKIGFDFEDICLDNQKRFSNRTDRSYLGEIGNTIAYLVETAINIRGIKNICRFIFAVGCFKSSELSMTFVGIFAAVV